MPRFAFFLYKKHAKNGKKAYIIQRYAYAKPSTDCFHFDLSNNIVCDDLQPIYKSLKDKLEFYCHNLMKNRIFDFKRRFLSFFNFMLFQL